MSVKSKMILRHPAAIRVFHWANMISITLLILTGFYIHSPLQFTLFSTMDTARTIHFVFMYVLLFSTIGPVWYGIYTKDYRNVWFRLSDIKDFGSLAMYYLFIRTNTGLRQIQSRSEADVYRCPVYDHYSGDHRFILYLPGPLAGWAAALGGPLVIRMIHYCVTWLFVLSIMVHVYLDLAEGLPVLKSMFTGKIPADFHADVKIPRSQKG